MTKKPDSDHTGAVKAGKNSEPGPKDQKAPNKQTQSHGNQERHGGGEGLTGLQPGDGHPRGR